ncbi:putative holin-like toxin [Paenibacillus ehimensis]|uniref:Holin-like toxin n=1 Tax=Paenibacillus ehimensis TaxID=79264 RepID=A0ABT8V9D2_9BACL|nr:putative holin-like toxin [Paenibacillus ehimensis]MDO3677282.1 putative holin-like toxin [Paenibacillus ehimensis]
MPVEVKDTLTLMIGFGMLLVALFTLVVNIIVALIQNKKK